MRMKNKGPKTKADIRFGWKRRGLLVCLFLSLVVLILEGVDNRHTAGYRFAMDMLYALAWAGLELESLLRLGREVREKGFGSYWKFNKADLFYLVLSPMALVISLDRKSVV